METITNESTIKVEDVLYHISQGKNTVIIMEKNGKTRKVHQIKKFKKFIFDIALNETDDPNPAFTLFVSKELKTVISNGRIFKNIDPSKPVQQILKETIKFFPNDERYLTCPNCKTVFRTKEDIEGKMEYNQTGINSYNIDLSKGSPQYKQKDFTAFDGGAFYCKICGEELVSDFELGEAYIKRILIEESDKDER